MEKSPFPDPLRLVFNALPSDLASTAHKAYEVETVRPRHIVYLRIDSFLHTHCVRPQLFGTETTTEGFPASDYYYGVLTTFTRTADSRSGIHLAEQ